MKKIDFNTRIIITTSDYNIEGDKRYLIPFQMGSKFGFINKAKQIIIPPQFDIVLDDFFNEKSLVRVGKYTARAYERKTMNPATSINIRYGILKADGTFLVPIEYESIAKPIWSNRYTLRSNSKGYAVIDYKGNIIVPFGKYDYIDGFDSGLARIKSGKTSNGLINSDPMWGIIDENGNENLKLEFANIWNFYGKDRIFTKVIKPDGKEFEFHFSPRILKYSGNQRDKDKELEDGMINHRSHCSYHESTYEENKGSYIQDIIGYSYQDIEDAFEGEPDAYWNID